jgi:Putative Flp pilus-assembly TadE/G-like
MGRFDLSDGDWCGKNQADSCPSISLNERIVEPSMKKIFGTSRSQNKSRRAGLGSQTAGAMKGSSGQVLVLVTMGIVVITAFAGFAVDVGQFWSARRHMQTAADAAAIAGASALRLNHPVTAAADGVTSTNGFTDGSNNVTVTVNNPPSAGVYAGNSSYVEVIVSQPQPTYFMRVLGYDTVGVTVRSVASSVNGPACLYALDPTASSALSVGGTSAGTLACGAIVDSSSSTAATTNGGGVFTASNIGVNGGYSGSGFSPTPVAGVAPAPDPLSYLQPPSYNPSACTYTNLHTGTTKGTNYLYPGVYCGGIQISGNNPVVFQQGTYILEGGGLKVTATKANLSGSQVMIYNTYSATYSYGPIALSGSNLVNLSAPTSGPYEGILFFQDRTVPKGSAGSTITGSSGSTFDGAVYFSTTAVSYGGSSSSGGYTIIVADTVSISGNATLSDNYSTLDSGSPIKATALYE